MYSDYSLDITQRYFSLVWLRAGDVLTISNSVNHFKNLHFCGILWAVMISLMFAQFDLHSTNTNTFTQSFSIIWCSFHWSVFSLSCLTISTWTQHKNSQQWSVATDRTALSITSHENMCLYNIIHSSFRKTSASFTYF